MDREAVSGAGECGHFDPLIPVLFEHLLYGLVLCHADWVFRMLGGVMRCYLIAIHVKAATKAKAIVTTHKAAKAMLGNGSGSFIDRPPSVD